MIRIHLPELLGRNRMTQQQLALRTGIRPGTISDIYNEMCIRISIEHLDKICEVLNCDLAELIEYVPNEVKIMDENLIKDPHGLRRKKNKG